MKNHNLFVGTNLPEPLEIAELYDLFEKMKHGDRIARDKIICHNIKLVIKEVIKRFSNTSYDLDELISIGFIGLIKSVDTFDITKGFLFSTYAARCINNEILNGTRDRKQYMNNISLEQPIGAGKEGTEFKIKDILSDSTSDLVADYEDHELYQIIRDHVDKLSGIDKIIIEDFFGLQGEPKKQREIAKKLGLTPQGVSKRLKNIIEKMKKQLQNNEEAVTGPTLILKKKNNKIAS